MVFIDFKKMKWLVPAGVALLTGCTMGPIHFDDEKSVKSATPTPNAEVEVCPSCSVEKPVLPPAGDCAKAVAVVNYADSCQACGRFPVTVRAYGQAENCK